MERPRSSCSFTATTVAVCLMTSAAACGSAPESSDRGAQTQAPTGGSFDSSSGVAGASVVPTAGSSGAATSDASVGAGDAAASFDATAPNADASSADGGPRVVPGSPGFLHTQGGKIVDAGGNPVRLTGISWFGMETSNYAPHGLWTRSLGSLLDQIVSLGFNVLRLPFCSQLFDPGVVPNGIDFAKNPELQGLAGLALMDAIVDAAGERGLRVILDRHRPDSNGQSALWYTAQYGEQRFLDDWKMLATHYKGDPTVIGFDLHNEPHDAATWGDGDPSTDWRAAAERAGNAILAIHPDLLIIVEGIQHYGGEGSWWGANLRGAKDHPVQLDVPNRVVYSPHDYPPSLYAQPWFSASDYPNNLPAVWRETWGYLAEDDLAPIWIGELGTKLETTADAQWLDALVDYIDAHELSFAYWCINPNSGDTGGILKDDWMSVNQNKLDALAKALAPQLP